MKKYSWIFALILALTLAFVFAACGGDDDEDKGKDEEEGGPVIPPPPPPYTGPKGLKVTAVSSWAGVDLADAGLHFEEGFVIEYAGTYLGPDGKQLLLNLNHSGWKPLDGWNPVLNVGDTFGKVFELTAGDVTDIAAASPKAIRVRGNEANLSFIISILKVKDADGEVIFDLNDVLSGLDVGCDDFDAIFDGTSFVPAGSAPAQVLAEVVKVEQKGLKVTAVSSWAGVDLADAGIHFAEDFTIEYSGVYLGPEGKQLLLNLNHSGWKPMDGWNPVLSIGDMFSKDFTVTAGDVTDIAAASPKAIRVRGNEANLSFIIITLKVKDADGAIVFDLKDAISGLDVGCDVFDDIFDGTKFVPAGSAPAQVLAEVVKVVE